MPTMHLEPITEVTADDRGRVGLGKAGARKDERYAVSKAGDGTIVLTPVTSIPTRELVIWENDEFRSSLLRGIGEFAAGKVEPLDWSIFGDDTDDEG